MGTHTEVSQPHGLTVAIGAVVSCDSRGEAHFTTSLFAIDSGQDGESLVDLFWLAVTDDELTGAAVRVNLVHPSPKASQVLSQHLFRIALIEFVEDRACPSDFRKRIRTEHELLHRRRVNYDHRKRYITKHDDPFLASGTSIPSGVAVPHVGSLLH
ncbi:MAG: hypothetical protein GXY83_27780 [Rhodopirellula sp.]|nr:hypothetical protein [Rhodopirellula sp.]